MIFIIIEKKDFKKVKRKVIFVFAMILFVISFSFIDVKANNEPILFEIKSEYTIDDWNYLLSLFDLDNIVDEIPPAYVYKPYDYISFYLYDNELNVSYMLDRTPLNTDMIEFRVSSGYYITIKHNLDIGTIETIESPSGAFIGEFIEIKNEKPKTFNDSFFTNLILSINGWLSGMYLSFIGIIPIFWNTTTNKFTFYGVILLIIVGIGLLRLALKFIMDLIK